MRFISDTVHGYADYIVAIALILLPFILGFQSISLIGHWLSVAAGAGLLVYSMLTGYSLGLRNLVSFRLHLVFDFVAGALFVLAPFIFSFSGVMQIYYLVFGTAIILLVVFTNPQPAAVGVRAAA